MPWQNLSFYVLLHQVFTTQALRSFGPPMRRMITMFFWFRSLSGTARCADRRYTLQLDAVAFSSARLTMQG